MLTYQDVNKQIKKTREEILAELESSMLKRNVVGIIMKDTRELITTGVASIEHEPDHESIVVLYEQDLHGFPVERTRIEVGEIDSVIRFNIAYDDQEYVKVRKIEKFKA